MRPLSYTDEYEKNLLEPARKLREDVEAEWLPKVQALEARAKEKEIFYKALYDSVHGLKSENSKLKEVSRRGASFDTSVRRTDNDLPLPTNRKTHVLKAFKANTANYCTTWKRP